MAKDVTDLSEKPSISHVEPTQTGSVHHDSDKRRGSGIHVPFVHNKDKHDPEWDGSDVDFSHINTKKVLRKMDLRIIPNLALLYLLSFLDRGNIGNARIEGLLEDLSLSGPQYNWCLTVFFFTYCTLRTERSSRNGPCLQASADMLRRFRTAEQPVA